MSRLGLIAVLALVACGSDGGAGDSDGGVRDGGGDPDVPDLRCDDPLVDFELGDLGMLDFRAEVESAGALTYLDLFASTAPGPVVDIVQIQLWPLGALSGGLAPGTYEISGAETDFYSCGACALVIADFEFTSMTFQQQLMAASGTLQIDEVSTTVGQTVSGTLTGATFREVLLDDNQMSTTNVPGGCTTAIDSVSFSAIVQNAN